ncbi:branched-chain amino acid transport system II carrier protein [Intestinibacter sp.]|uniref:branched-chain amino acid transport system II carrier protein n=1 Tax=Intestinibacter sp. TaxID=1965304 RepID=UPI002A74B75F|nr:branched-chain amino acid transport system II carrier protein [Intestinibacter sp.]MDY2737126.1 branched-chain amino acid transport system II carrier protein [Intestinibacter sp.]MDY4575640.1 branched-chain amino acid transport system II carrier protein [Intestinibacter sp.]
MTTKNKDIIITGFALFAMFFGAGNLIFPPYLGVITGEKFLIGFLGFILADVGLSLLAILASAKSNGDTEIVFKRAGKKFALILGASIMICLGPLLAIPRTAATTFEMGIVSLMPNFNPILFSIIFFSITLLLTIKPSKVVDIIGSYLTPALLVCLLLIIAVGIINPIGNIDKAAIQNVFSEGILQGYQTLDALGAICLSAVLIKSLAQKGYKEEKDRIDILLKAGVVAAIGLTVVYGGLTYLGATVSSVYDVNVSQSSLIVAITSALLKTPGKIILSLIVSLACLTTAIGLTSATAEYFSKATNGRLKYEQLVVGVCIFSLVISNLGVESIIKISAPILSLIYPATIVLIVMTIFKKFVENDNIVKFSTYTALFMGVLMAGNDLGINVPFLEMLPLANLGFCWVFPTFIAGIVGYFIKPNRNKEYEEDEERAV